MLCNIAILLLIEAWGSTERMSVFGGKSPRVLLKFSSALIDIERKKEMKVMFLQNTFFSTDAVFKVLR
jgi:hypothetical protein